MSRLMLRTMLTTGLLLGTATAGFAAPVPMANAPRIPTLSSNVQPVYYVWNHHRYVHRRWDKAHRRWNYYN